MSEASANYGVEEDEADAFERAVEDRIERKEDLKNAFSQVFSTPNGELILGYLAVEYRVHSSLMQDGEELSPLSLALREGARIVVLDIIRRASELSNVMRVPTGKE